MAYRYFFSKTKYINKIFIKNGGWHFSNIKDVDSVELKLKSYLHHKDYEAEELGKEKIAELIKNNETIYDMFGDKKSKKYGDEAIAKDTTERNLQIVESFSTE